MELTCPKCNTNQLVSDDEIFPSCNCGYVFETMPVLDRALSANANIELPKIKKRKFNIVEEIIISTGSSVEISKHLGIVVAQVIIPEAVVVDELAKDVSTAKMVNYQQAVTKLVSKLKDQAISLKADAVIGLRFEHTILPVALGGPGILVFAQGTAVKIS